MLIPVHRENCKTKGIFCFAAFFTNNSTLLKVSKEVPSIASAFSQRYRAIHLDVMIQDS